MSNSIRTTPIGSAPGWRLMRGLLARARGGFPQLRFDVEATKLSDTWLAQYRDQIKRLPHDRQEACRQITALSTAPQDIDLAQPTSRIEATAVREQDGRETKLPMHKDHLLCDEQGIMSRAVV
jgi:hypothetical protein